MLYSVTHLTSVQIMKLKKIRALTDPGPDPNHDRAPEAGAGDGLMTRDALVMKLEAVVMR